VQIISFLPYFISPAVIVSIVYNLLSPSTGLVNNIIRTLGGKSINFLAEPGWFRPIYVILDVWQTFGYSAIIYIAAIVAIDPALYEAAEVDGASRWQKMFKITLPCISTSIVVMLIISVGNIFTVNLERILLMYNQSIYSTADVIQTYVYRIAFQSTGFPDYSYGTTVNILKSVIAFVLVVIVNKFAEKIAESRLF
jgi:putative aldouronate transport system permease protein